jgi:hypothetical protein
MLVLLGWALDATILKTLAGNVPMRPHSAVCAVLTGLGLWCERTRGGSRTGRRIRQLTAVTCGLVVAAVGAVTMGQYLFAWNAGIDDLLFHVASGPEDLADSSRMPFIAALAFAALGLAVALQDWEWPSGHWVSSKLAFVAGVTGFISLTGNLLHFDPFYRVTEDGANSMAASMIVTVLGGGPLSIRPARGVMAPITSEHGGGLLARRVLPAALAVPLAAAWVEGKGKAAGIRGTEFGLTLFMIVGLVVVVWLTARRLNEEESRLRLSEQKARQAEDAAGSARARLQTPWRAEAWRRSSGIFAALRPGWMRR